MTHYSTVIHEFVRIVKAEARFTKPAAATGACLFCGDGSGSPCNDCGAVMLTEGFWVSGDQVKLIRSNTVTAFRAS